MKTTRIISLMLAVLIAFSCCCISVCADGETSSSYTDNPGITSGNAVIAYCLDEEQFLYTARADERVAPVVATKLVACMVVMDIIKENGLTTNDSVTVTQAAIDNAGNIYDPRVPIMNLKASSVYSAKDLLSAALVANANDAITSLVCHYSETYLDGGLTEFVERMNKKVSDLGLKNTNFTNPTGINSPEQYSTPREVALIAAAFYKYNELVTFSNVSTFLFNGKQTVRSKNYLKNDYVISGFLNKNAIGLIAGELNTFGNYCLITASQKEGKTFIYVVMCAKGMKVERIDEETHISFGEGNAYDDMNLLISWTQRSFKLLEVATTETIVGELRVNLGEKGYVIVVPAEKIEKLVPEVENGDLQSVVNYDPDVVYKKEFNGKELYTVNAPVTAGQRVGTVTYTYNGVELATVDVVAKEGIASDALKSSYDSMKRIIKWLMIGIVVVVGVAIAYGIFVVVMSIIRNTGAKKAAKRKSGVLNAPQKPVSKQKKSKKKPSKKHDVKTDTRDFG